MTTKIGTIKEKIRNCIFIFDVAIGIATAISFFFPIIPLLSKILLFMGAIILAFPFLPYKISENKSTDHSEKNVPSRRRVYAEIGCMVCGIVIIIASTLIIVHSLNTSTESENETLADSPSIMSSILDTPRPTRKQYNDLSDEEMLRDAEAHLVLGEYDDALSIYQSGRLLDSAVALCNIGYIYGFGLDEKNYEEAIVYTQKASEQESEQADLNLIYYLIQSQTDAQSDSKTEQLSELFKRYCEKNDDIRGYLEECNITNDEFNNFYIYKLYDWEYSKVAIYTAKQSSNWWHKYELVSSDTVAGLTMYTYNVYSKVPRFTEMIMPQYMSVL